MLPHARHQAARGPCPASRSGSIVPRPLVVGQPFLARPRVASSAASTADMLQVVHRWFDSLHSPDHAIEDLVAPDAHLIDNTSQACYSGYRAIKHRLQSVHEVLPKLVEAADVADAAHASVAAHWVAKGGGEPASGSYVFKFNAAGLISEITAYADAAEDEFLEA